MEPLKEEKKQPTKIRSPESESESDSEFETDSEEDELQYRGVRGLLYRAKDFGEDLLYFANESATLKTVKKIAYTGKSLSEKGGKIAWVVGTSLIVMVLPLVLEVSREQAFVEQQQQMMAAMSPQQLAQMGMMQPRR
eukprot:g602.t1